MISPALICCSAIRVDSASFKGAVEPWRRYSLYWEPSCFNDVLTFSLFLSSLNRFLLIDFSSAVKLVSVLSVCVCQCVCQCVLSVSQCVSVCVSVCCHEDVCHVISWLSVKLVSSVRAAEQKLGESFLFNFIHYFTLNFNKHLIKTLQCTDFIPNEASVSCLLLFNYSTKLHFKCYFHKFDL